MESSEIIEHKCEHNNHFIRLSKGIFYMSCNKFVKIKAKEVKMTNNTTLKYEVKDAQCPYCFNGRVVYNESSKIFHCNYCKKEVNIEVFTKC